MTLGSLERDPTHSGRNVVDGSVHVTLEAMDVTTIALDMPHKPAKSSELGAAPIKPRRTVIHTLVMRGAVQVRIE